ncbi:hypothetical protein TWF128_011050 [Orbilia oligospora]|nr:hypothetical protein TWF128_011050 [Orbilia oligospora]
MPTGAIVLTPLSGEEACCGVSTLTNTLRLYTRPYWRIAHSDGKPRTREFELDTADTADQELKCDFGLYEGSTDFGCFYVTILVNTSYGSGITVS